MRIISRKTLRDYWEKNPEPKQALIAWYADVKNADWKSPSDIKKVYGNVSFVANDRVIFNIKGNKYRLVIVVLYRFGIVYIRFIGSHQEYDKIDAATI